MTIPLDPGCGIGSWGVLEGTVSENGRLRQATGAHPGGDRRRSGLMLTTLTTERGSVRRAQAPKGRRLDSKRPAAYRRAVLPVHSEA